jgi:hypothetical protein
MHNLGGDFPENGEDYWYIILMVQIHFEGATYWLVYVPRLHTSNMANLRVRANATGLHKG